MVKHPYVPRKGDIVWMTLHPTRGHKQKGRHPALVLSPQEYNAQAGLVLVCPLSTRVKNYPFEVELVFKGSDGAILVDQIRSIDWRVRKVIYVKKCEQSVMAEVQQKLLILIE